jgi:small subunit ribosomal protein S3
VGQKVHPIGFRLGINETWKSLWFARDSYGKQALEDIAIRTYLDKTLKNAELSSVNIEKAGDNVRVIIASARPGVVIGKKGSDIESLRKKVAAMLPGRAVEVSVEEVRSPETDAMVIARSIADQIERRVSYKKAMKRAATTALRSGAKGIKIRAAGRLAGAEIARTEWLRVGSIPLHTLRAQIDYARVVAQTTYGVIGISVWVHKGEYGFTK